MNGLEKHHIVFKSQGGLDFAWNYIFLTPEQHRGDEGPHKCRERDLELKRNMQKNLREILREEEYSLEEIISILGLKRRQAEKAFKRVQRTEGKYRTEHIIKRLMGGRFY